MKNGHNMERIVLDHHIVVILHAIWISLAIYLLFYRNFKGEAGGDWQEL